MIMKRHHLRFLKTGHTPAKVNTTQQQNGVEETLKPLIKAAAGETASMCWGRLMPLNK